MFARSPSSSPPGSRHGGPVAGDGGSPQTAGRSVCSRVAGINESRQKAGSLAAPQAGCDLCVECRSRTCGRALAGAELRKRQKPGIPPPRARDEPQRTGRLGIPDAIAAADRVVFLRDKGDHPQVQRRFDLTRNMVGRRTGLCMMSGAKEIPSRQDILRHLPGGFRELLHGLPEPGGSHSGPGIETLKKQLSTPG